MFLFIYSLMMNPNILLEILPYENIRQATSLHEESFPLSVYTELPLCTWLYWFSHNSQRYWASRSFSEMQNQIEVMDYEYLKAFKTLRIWPFVNKIVNFVTNSAEDLSVRNTQKKQV